MKKIVICIIISIGTATAVIAHEDGLQRNLGCSVQAYGPGCH